MDTVLVLLFERSEFRACRHSFIFVKVKSILRVGFLFGSFFFYIKEKRTLYYLNKSITCFPINTMDMMMNKVFTYVAPLAMAMRAPQKAPTIMASPIGMA
jgi:hypothetical protein